MRNKGFTTKGHTTNIPLLPYVWPIILYLKFYHRLYNLDVFEYELWNGMAFNFETILQAHDQAVRSMCWSRDGNWLATGDHGGNILIHVSSY